VDKIPAAPDRARTPVRFTVIGMSGRQRQIRASVAALNAANPGLVSLHLASTVPPGSVRQPHRHQHQHQRGHQMGRARRRQLDLRRHPHEGHCQPASEPVTRQGESKNAIRGIVGLCPTAAWSDTPQPHAIWGGRPSPSPGRAAYRSSARSGHVGVLIAHVSGLVQR